MADAVLFKVEGLKELGEAFRRLTVDMQVRAGRSATGAAATPIKRRAINNIKSSPSVETGALSKSVIVKRLPKNQTPHGRPGLDHEKAGDPQYIMREILYHKRGDVAMAAEWQMGQ